MTIASLETQYAAQIFTCSIFACTPPLCHSGPGAAAALAAANIRVENDTVEWDDIGNASGYHAQWDSAAGQLRFVTEEVTRNSFSMSEFHYTEKYYVKVQAVSSDKTAYQDSRWTGFYVLVRPRPIATPT